MCEDREIFEFEENKAVLIRGQRKQVEKGTVANKYVKMYSVFIICTVYLSPIDEPSDVGRWIRTLSRTTDS